MADFLTSTNTQTANVPNPQAIDVSSPGTTNVAAPTYASQEQGDTVENRLSNLLEKDNPFLVSARSRATQDAAAMGRQNMALNATAGEKAAIESALPIAQQDAGYYQQRALAGQQGEIESFLSGQTANQQAGLYNIQGKVGSQLSSQESQQAREAQILAGEQNIDLQKLRGDQDISLQQLRGEQDIGLQQLRGEQEAAKQQAEIEWNKVDLEARMQVEYDRMDQATRAQFDETANIIGSEYTQRLMAILSDPAFPNASSRNTAIEALNQQTMARYRIASAAANANIYWSWGPASVRSAPTESSNVQTQPVGAPIPITSDSANWTQNIRNL
jgi:hypothetical protein